MMEVLMTIKQEDLLAGDEEQNLHGCDRFSWSECCHHYKKKHQFISECLNLHKRCEEKNE